MARSTTIAAVLYIVLSAGVHSQLYEFLEALQPIVKSHPAFGEFPAYDSIFTTKKPKTFNRHPTRQRTEEKKDRKPAAISTLESYLRDDAKKKDLGQTHSTTTKPVNKHSNQRNDKPRSSSRNTAREIHSSQKENLKIPSRNVYDTLLVLDNISNEKRKHSEDKISFVTRTTKRYENTTTKPYYSAESYNIQSNNHDKQNYYNPTNSKNNQSNDYIQFSNDEPSNDRKPYNYDNQDNDNKPSNNQNSQSSEYNPQSTNNNRGTNNNRQTNNYNQDSDKRQSNNNQNSQSSEYNPQSTNNNRGSNNRQNNNYNQDSNNRQSNNNQNSQSSEYNPQSTNNNRGMNNNRQTNNYNQNSDKKQSNNNQNSQSSEYNTQLNNNRGTNNNRQTKNYNQDSDKRPSNNNQNSQSSEYNPQSNNNRGSNNRHTNYNQDNKNRQSNTQNSQSKEYIPNYNPSKNYVLTTQNPFYNRPGVRPAAVDDKRPPITNRPPSRRTTTLRPIHIVPKDTRIPPELITVPGEDTMSEAERLRHIDVSERMCGKYKKLYTKQLQAIPLVPSPEALEINVTSCTPTRIPLIVGGTVVTIKEFPHMALIGWVKLNYDGYAWRCGGSLISDRFVLTAAHCAYEERDNSVIMGTPRAVQLGSSFLDDPNAIVMKISTVIRHPKYKLPKSYYDIALIKMSGAITFSEFIRPACLGVPPTPSESIIATGWGRTEFGGDQSRELRGVSLEVWEEEECRRALGKSRKLPNGPSADSQLCAGSREGGKDTCQGDSGGPAQIQDGCVWRVVAVTSVGRACGAANTPALYAIAHRAFISSVVFNEQSISSEVEQIDLNEQRYHPSRSTETFNYQTNNWKSQRNTDNSKGIGNNHNFNYNNQQSNDYANNYEAYNQPYYNDAPTWF